MSEGELIFVHIAPVLRGSRWSQEVNLSCGGNELPGRGRKSPGEVMRASSNSFKRLPEAKLPSISPHKWKLRSRQGQLPYFPYFPTVSSDACKITLTLSTWKQGGCSLLSVLVLAARI